MARLTDLVASIGVVRESPGPAELAMEGAREGCLLSAPGGALLLPGSPEPSAKPGWPLPKAASASARSPSCSRQSDSSSRWGQGCVLGLALPAPGVVPASQLPESSDQITWPKLPCLAALMNYMRGAGGVVPVKVLGWQCGYTVVHKLHKPTSKVNHTVCSCNNKSTDPRG